MTYTQTYDAENRLKTVTAAGGQTTTYVYDGDGKRVKKVQGGQTTVYIGNYYEKNLATGVVTTYYYANGQRVAQRRGGTVYYLTGDRLGSTSLLTDASGGEVGRQRYYPYGTPRNQSGTLATDYRFTGQRSEEATLGLLYDYDARFYSPALGRFLSADTIVPSPGDPQSLNRYSYVGNRPLNRVDPSGHWGEIPSVNGGIGCTGFVGAGTVTSPAHPALQPLTINVPNDERPIMTADRTTHPDDGVLLTYANPGELRPRTEVVGYALGLPEDTPFGGARVEERRVTIHESFFDWSVRRTYAETAVSGRIGPISAEWASSKGAVDPTISVGPVDLQPGQLMVGLTNPTGGPGGARGGAQFQLPSNSLYALSRGELSDLSGVGAFGRQFKSDSTLIREVYVSGQWTRRGWLSGYDLLRFQLDNYGLAYEGAPQ